MVVSIKPDASSMYVTGWEQHLLRVWLPWWVLHQVSLAIPCPNLQPLVVLHAAKISQTAEIKMPNDDVISSFISQCS